jgi:phosphoesterase RecJ-like protein
MPRYQIPIRDSLVVGHADPDGDSLSSVKAVLNHLRSKGRSAKAMVSGKVPDHLGWILSENDMADDDFKCGQTIVLDCEPTSERVGFPLSGDVVNIDHHETRRGDHDPNCSTYVLNRCSTAAALILDFGILDEILLVGLYTDSLFIRGWNELQKCFRRIKISDDHAHIILSSCRPTRDKKALHVVQTAKLRRCRNGFIIAETEEKDQGVISEVMETLFRYAEGVCLIDGMGKARLRTSNEKVDVGAIAKTFGGGGHSFASGCNVNGKRTVLMSVIKQLEIPPTRLDFEGESDEEENGRNHAQEKPGTH